MGDSLNLRRSSEASCVTTAKKVSKGSLVAACPRAASNTFRHIASGSHGIFGSGAVSQAALFLLKVAALEMVRRFSMANFPFAWHGLQTLQMFCYPPFKWIQRWAPFKGLVGGMQKVSRPVLFLSIATAFSDEAECCSGISDGGNDLNTYPEPGSEQSPVQPSMDTRTSDGSFHVASENWLTELHKELKKQGICLPERIDDDELRRFYSVGNGDLTSLLTSVKKTICWRANYRILSAQELETWSDMVFWHGFDVQNRPCLIIRLGFACTTLPSRDKPRFAQAVVSQVEHGVLHLVDPENSQITVLVDCYGLSPLKVPMKMIRSCCSILQDHFPCRLGCLFVIRLPPLVRVLAQTLIQVLKPMTRKKLKIEGEMYKKLLSDYLLALPSYLGGKCTCTKCLTIGISHMPQPPRSRMNNVPPITVVSNGGNPPAPHPADEIDIQLNGNCDQVVRTAMISILMLWVFMALVAGFVDPESRPFLHA